MKVFCDTSVLVASALASHPHHPEAKAALARIRAGQDAGFASAHTLAETFSVLSRMPTKPKLDPDAVLDILETDFIPHPSFVALFGDRLSSGHPGPRQSRPGRRAHLRPAASSSGRAART